MEKERAWLVIGNNCRGNVLLGSWATDKNHADIFIKSELDGLFRVHLDVTYDELIGIVDKLQETASRMIEMRGVRSDETNHCRD